MLIFNKNLDELFFMMKFISGLKEENKGYVATMNPTTLDQAIVLARRQENMVNALFRKTNQHQKNNQNRTPFKPPNKSLPYKPSFKPSLKPIDENPQSRRFLTEAEVRARKEKNLCYKCDEPYSPGHRCRIRQVHMLLTKEEAKAYEEGDEPSEELHDEENAIVAVYIMSESVNSQTLRVNVRVANGEKVMSNFICPSFCWEIQGYHFSHPVRVLKLGGYDCVLGCDWLSTKNPIGLDFHQLQDIFQEPKNLPPERAIEHNIEFMPDVIPRKQHPYRYAYGQKTEIERIVKMLDSGIIRTSQSSFASLVLLVKKNDGGMGTTHDSPKESTGSIKAAPTLCQTEKFIKGYGVLSKPLTSLLKKDAFIWNPEAEAAFEDLKKVMTNAPVLALPNFFQPFVVEIDAVERDRTVLMQKGRPIAYLSKALYKKGVITGLLMHCPEWSMTGENLTAIPSLPSYEKRILRRQGRVCVGSHGGIKEKIIKSLYDSAFGGHSDPNMRMFPTLACYSHYLSPAKSGPVSPWILLKGCHLLKGMTQSWMDHGHQIEGEIEIGGELGQLKRNGAVLKSAETGNASTHGMRL
ncbi:UNVERIFIED_CONTAM: Retrovirus-related Pol polyprotein from transposon.6 [Sesamum latifolium]|uniref:Retrovirus-related Pol polyprotein from transposon.6 n=1 Tax=Sesamum latifolium TaxID=2727402 RepID=A0AAW2Y839_9LAMI